MEASRLACSWRPLERRPCQTATMAMAATLPLCIFLLLSSCSVIPFTQAQYLANFLNVRYLDCLRNNTDPLPASFLLDLNAILLNFTALASRGVAYASARPGPTSAGGPYAMFQCRGDLSVQTCAACVENVTAELPPACPAFVGARLGTEGCLVRYDNQSFFDLDTSYVTAFCNPYSTSDVVALTAISDTMQNVTSEAPERPNLFAKATQSGVYAAAQCWGYLNETQCSQCLLAMPYRSLCNSRQGEQVHLASCMYRFEVYDFLEQPTPSSPSPNASSAAPSTPPQASPASKTAIIAGSAVGGVIIGLVLLCILVWLCKANRNKGERASGIKQVEKSASLPHKLFQNRASIFSLEEMEKATDQFNPINMLGKGAFGIVYKGTLSNGQIVAIKKLSIRSHGTEEFLNEVNVLTSVQHKNLIRLLGCCVESPEKILVYEYLPNKSLDNFLSPRKSQKLNWSARFGIVIGMAKGLAYLHEESYVRIIHRDIKPGNILLDDQLNPVIADFGLARLTDEDATHICTGVAGTLGYMAPEYYLHRALSEKVDVFSYGMVCLEIVTGKNHGFSGLLAWVWEKYEDGRVLDVVDESLGDVFSPEQVARVVHIALLCTQGKPKERPAMSTVILWLSGMSDILKRATRPTFLNYGDSVPLIVDGQTSSSTHQFSPFSGAQSESETFGPR